MLGIINDVLDMSKIESGKTTMNVGEFYLPDLFDQIDTAFRPQTDAKRQSFVIDVQKLEHKWLWGDSMRLLQILNNLLSNAFRYASQKVGLKLTVTAQDLKMSIGDDGTGFQENTDTVTQAFYHEYAQDDLKHFGMGMYISRIYCERHGGKLLIKNVADGGAEVEAVFKNYVLEEQQQK